MGVDFARRLRSRMARRGLVRRVLSSATCLVLVATSITVPAAAAASVDSNSQGTNLSNGAATNQLAPVTAAPTLPLKFADSSSGGNVSVRPSMSTAKAPSARTEIASLRGQYSRTYENANGTYNLQLSGTRLNYQDTNGAWQPIDTSLVAAPTSSGWDYTEKANDKTVYISNSHPATGLAQLSVGPHTLTVRVPSALSVSAPTESASDVSLTSPAGTFGVTPTPEGFDFSATLGGTTAPTSYSFAIGTGGLAAKLDADGQTIDLTDPAATNPNAIAGLIGAPSLLDSTGAHAPANAVGVTLSSAASGLAPGEVLVTYALDPAWINAGGRSFPVTLDPPVCLQYGNSSCNGSLTYTATRIDNPNPLPGTQESYSLFWFGMVTLADGAAITGATLKLEKASGDTGQTVQAWTNTTGFDGSTTWTSRPSFDSPSSGAATTCAGVCQMSLDVSDIVRTWYSRGPAYQSSLRVGFLANYGVTVKQGSASATQLHFYGNTAQQSYRPELDITYFVGGYTMAFDPNMGPDYAPTTTVADGTAVLPLSVTNTSAYGWADCASSPSSCWYVGYRWYDDKANLKAIGKAADLPSGGVTSGSTSGLLRLSITTPDAGQ